MFIFSDFTYNKSLCVLLKYKASHIKASKKICPTILKKQNQENQIILHIEIIPVSNETLCQPVPTIDWVAKAQLEAVITMTCGLLEPSGEDRIELSKWFTWNYT